MTQKQAAFGPRQNPSYDASIHAPRGTGNFGRKPSLLGPFDTRGLARIKAFGLTAQMGD
ncbi:hypothetical protein [Tateyamaria sp.]|uniref:hypothetical protein n=1 Tax=Tateyamaria sp. TaxID=1929288 RepID=UPI003B21D620